MVENGMHFDEKEVSDLATALFEDAVQVRRLGVVEMVVEMVVVVERFKSKDIIEQSQPECSH